MVKRLSAIIAVLLALTVSLSASQLLEKKLLGMVPEKSEVVVSADLTDLLNYPAFKKSMAESRDIAVYTKNTGISPVDCGAFLFWAKGEKYALLLAFKRAFDPRKVFKAPLFQCRKVPAESGTLYHVKSLKSPRKAAKRAGINEISFYVAPLAGDAVAFFSHEKFASEALKEMKGKRGFSYDPRLKGSFRGIARGGALPVTEALLSCNVRDKKKGDLDIFFSAEFKSAEEAAAANEQISMMVSFLLLQVMQKEPDLATELVKCLKFQLQGKQLVLKTVVRGTLLERLGKFLSETKKKKSAAKRRKTAAPKSTGVAAQ